MINLIAAALIAAAPAAPAPVPAQASDAHAQHQRGDRHDQHKGMDCCKDCCRHMAKEQDGSAAKHGGHKGHSSN